VAAVLPLAKVGERLLFAGQDVAAVAATSPQLARAALLRISATYQAEPHVVTTRAAMQADAPVVHKKGKVEERATEGDEPGAGGGGATRGNVRATPSMKKGDVDKGLRGAKTLRSARRTRRRCTRTRRSRRTVWWSAGTATRR
jgi:xanthine dehydrogenase YagR molybdenum-binding subunit